MEANNQEKNNVLTKEEKKEKKNKTIALEKLMIKYLNNKDYIKEKEEENKSLSKLILDAMSDLEIKKHILEVTPSNKDHADDEVEKSLRCSFNMVTRAFIDYNIPLIKKILGKKRFMQIAERELYIDYDKYVAIAKKYNIPREEAMSCLQASYKISNQKLQYAYETGSIDLNELKGTYTVDKKTYLDVRRTK